MDPTRHLPSFQQTMQRARPKALPRSPATSWRLPPCSVQGSHREVAMSTSKAPSAPGPAPAPAPAPAAGPSHLDRLTAQPAAKGPAEGVRKLAGSYDRTREPAQSSGRQQEAGSSSAASEEEVRMFERALAYARARKARTSSSSSSSAGYAALSPAAPSPSPSLPLPPSPLPPEEYALLLHKASALVHSHPSPEPAPSPTPVPQPPLPPLPPLPTLASIPRPLRPPSPPPSPAPPLDEPLTYESRTFTIRLLDDITPATLPDLPPGRYQFCSPSSPPSPSPSAPSAPDPSSPAAILLRSHQLTISEVPPSVCCIARCGPGAFTNVPVARMTELGIPVFNTPGANSNAVKELVVCALVMAARGVLEAAAHVNQVYEEEQMVHSRIVQRFDAARPQFKGSELEGKTLGVVGLGAVGSRVVGAALALGMKVVGFDPWISPEATWKLPGDRMTRAEVLDDLLMDADYISVHVPYFNRATHHLINASNLPLCKPRVHILNFSPAQIIDGAALRALYDAGRLTGRYIADFSDPHLLGHRRHLVLPHLGACTREAEDKSAAMAGASVQEFLETGNVRQSVNFPPVVLKKKPFHEGPRLCIVVQNEPGFGDDSCDSCLLPFSASAPAPAPAPASACAPAPPGVLGHIATFLGSRGVNIEQEVTGSRGSLAYMMLDIGPVDDPAALQVQLARECPGIISSRFISDVGGPHTLFNINTSTWPSLDSFELDDTASCSSVRWSVDLGSREEDDDEDEEEDEEE